MPMQQFLEQIQSIVIDRRAMPKTIASDWCHERRQHVVAAARHAADLRQHPIVVNRVLIVREIGSSRVDRRPTMAARSSMSVVCDCQCLPMFETFPNVESI